MQEGLTFQPILTMTIKTTDDIESHRFVEGNGKKCRLGYYSIGVSQISTLSGELAPIISLGSAIVLSNANLIAGAELSSDDLGRAINRESGSALTGIALTNAAVGDKVKILIK